MKTVVARVLDKSDGTLRVKDLRYTAYREASKSNLQIMSFSKCWCAVLFILLLSSLEDAAAHVSHA